MPSRVGPILQLKVQLLGVRPPVWRRLLVPANLVLGDLHRLIQDSMGWTDTHLHEFEAGGLRYGSTDPEDENFHDEDVHGQGSVSIDRFLRKEKESIAYTYDFGDDWRHKITLEARLPVEEGLTYPLCTGGKRACPPEDCGGPWGYADLLAALADPKRENHQEMAEWAPPRFDPE